MISTFYIISEIEKNILLTCTLIYTIFMILLLYIENFVIDPKQERRRDILRNKKKYISHKIIEKEIMENSIVGFVAFFISILFFFGMGFGWYVKGGFWKSSNLDEFMFVFGGSLILSYGIHTFIFNVAILSKNLSSRDPNRPITFNTVKFQVRKDEVFETIAKEKIENMLSKDKKLIVGKTRIIWTNIDTLMIISIILYPIISTLYATIKIFWIVFVIFIAIIALLIYKFFNLAYKEFEKKNLKKNQIKYLVKLEIFQITFTMIVIFIIWSILQSIIPESDSNSSSSILILIETFAFIGMINRSINKNRKIKFCKMYPNHKICK